MAERSHCVHFVMGPVTASCPAVAARSPPLIDPDDPPAAQVIFDMDPGLSPESSISVGDNMKNEPKTVYRCKKCRRVVAAPENVIGHTPGDGESRFGWQQKRKNGNKDGKLEGTECTSMFVEPLKWMTSVEEGELKGKLSCINCGARLGFFNWCGTQCSCSSWVAPAFQIHKSNIDVSIEFP